MTVNRHQRRSARAILLDSEGRILLIRFEVTRQSKPFAFWATPGGTVEAGESDYEAVRRELIEELHLDLRMEGPVHAAVDEFEHEGEAVVSTDLFFVGRCERNAPRLDPLADAERAAMRELRWWSTSEIDASDEPIFPADLATVLRKIG